MKEAVEFPDLKADAAKGILDTSGVISCMVKSNPQLIPRLVDFLVGPKRVLVVGGESGNGKSLICADLNLLHKDLSNKYSALKTPISNITWDRIHAMFFDEISIQLGHTVPLPEGETHPDIRLKATQALRDIVRFAFDNLSANTRILVEAPLIDQRGEQVIFDGYPFRSSIQTLIMHNPKLRRETYKEGRLKKTSGQPQSMDAIRRKLLFNILGDSYSKLKPDEQDLVVKNYWVNFLKPVDGMVIDWDHDALGEERVEYQRSKKRFENEEQTPDRLTPKQLGKAARDHIESIFETIEDLPNFLDKAKDK